MQETCIIIPCYNEAERLDLEIFSNFIANNHYNFCFVNDGSKDGTGEICKKLTKQFPNQVYFLNLLENLGKGEAVRHGILEMLKEDKFSIIGYMDADLATPLEEISYLLDNFKYHYKVILGSRVQRFGVSIQRNLLRHYLGRIFATYVSLILNIKVYDSQCGAKFFLIKDVKDIFNQAFISKWLFDLEILIRLRKKYPDIYVKNSIEIPLRKWEEKQNSRIKFLDLLRAPFELLKIRE